MTCAAFGSPRVLVSCCKTISRSAVTAEVTVPAGLLTGNGLASAKRTSGESARFDLSGYAVNQELSDSLPPPLEL